jgi:hypothetical protein
MPQYKTALVDYEGLQDFLDSCGEQGWRLVSLTPDTWRRVSGDPSASRAVGMMRTQDDGAPADEFCASYYLLVFSRDDDPQVTHSHGKAVEVLDLPDYSFPDN